MQNKFSREEEVTLYLLYMIPEYHAETSEDRKNTNVSPLLHSFSVGGLQTTFEISDTGVGGKDSDFGIDFVK